MAILVTPQSLTGTMPPRPPLANTIQRPWEDTHAQVYIGNCLFVNGLWERTKHCTTRIRLRTCCYTCSSLLTTESSSSPSTFLIKPAQCRTATTRFKTAGLLASACEAALHLLHLLLIEGRILFRDAQETRVVALRRWRHLCSAATKVRPLSNRHPREEREKT